MQEIALAAPSDAMQTVLIWVGIGIVAMLVRWRDLFKLGRKTENDVRSAVLTEQQSIDHKLSSTRAELYASQERLLATANEDRARMRERISNVEASLKMLQERYDSQVMTLQTQQHRIEGLTADNARLIAENHNLTRRVHGRERKLDQQASDSEATG